MNRPRRTSRERTRSARRGLGRRRRRPVTMATDVEPVHVNEADNSCIDLTEPDDDQYVDLTSSQPVVLLDDSVETGANDQSVVVIGTPNDSPQGRTRTQRRNLPTVDAFDDDDSLLELPPVPFYLPTPSRSTSTRLSDLASPEAIKITCPVCLDDDKTIKRDKRKLASTTCGHVFCNDCIESAIRSNHCCPVCRKKLKLNNIHLLHI